MPSLSTGHNIYLSRVNHDLTLNVGGTRPRRNNYFSLGRVLIIGGGVTGLTVSLCEKKSFYHFFYRDKSSDCVDATGRWLRSDHTLRSMGITVRSYHIPNCWRFVRIILISHHFLIVIPTLALSCRWEWPPAVCGKHTNLDSLDKSKRWCMTSYRILEKLMGAIPAKEHGARMRMSNFFFHKKLQDMPEQLEKMLEIESVSGVRYCHLRQGGTLTNSTQDPGI